MTSNIQALAKAAEELALKPEFIDTFQDLLKISNGKESFYFHTNHTPFNNTMTARLCNDKDFSHRLLNESIKMPKTIGYLDPDLDEKYERYRMWESYDEIASDVEDNFKYPFILKRNKGSQGDNVFLIQDREQLQVKLKTIFNKNAKNYDYVALAQEYIAAKKEYRVVVSWDGVEFVYEKEVKDAVMADNLSPLHWEGAKAVAKDDPRLLISMKSIANKVHSLLNLNYGGLDIIEDVNGQYWLIEVNAAPSFAYYIRDNGEQEVVELYKKMLNALFAY